MKNLEKEQENNPKASRGKEIIRTEINKIENSRENKTKNLFSEKISKINKHLARLTKKKREKIPITNFRNEARDRAIDPLDIKRII